MFKRLYCIFILLTCWLGSYSQVVFRSLEDVWKYADHNNITIKTMKYELDKSVYAKKQAYSALLPQATATGSYTDNIALQTTLLPASLLGGPPGTYKTLQFGEQFVYTGGINAQMNILNLQNIYNVRIAQQTQEMNKDSLASTRRLVYQQLATQFYSYLLMQEASILADQTALIADSTYQSANNKFKEGTANEASVDLAKLNLERAQQSQITARYQMITSRNSLKGLLGFSVNDSLSINASLNTSLHIDAAEAFTEDLSLKLSLWRAKISLSQYRLSNSAFLPTINILYNYATQRYDKTFEPFSGATGVAGWFPSQYWSLQASFPIFTSGSRYFQSKRSKINYEESMAQYENAQKQSAINDENIRLNYQRAISILSKTQDVMNLSLDNYRHISYRYEAGLSPLDDRLNAFQNYIDYQNQYLNSLSDMLVQLYQVKIRQQSF
ncbi:MAG: TolC family protein [Flavipsychrobacter sp.]|nr:TolC family protein [Flavipsychrobacter sp.]